MESGKALDRLIAEKVMGLSICECDEVKLRNDWMDQMHKRMKDSPHFHYVTFCRFGSDNTCNFCSKAYPIQKYSTNIKAAWEVIIKLNFSGYDIEINMPHNLDVSCRFMPKNSFNEEGIGFAMSTTTPHAICLASLQALNIPHKD